MEPTHFNQVLCARSLDYTLLCSIDFWNGIRRKTFYQQFSDLLWIPGTHICLSAPNQSLSFSFFLLSSFSPFCHSFLPPPFRATMQRIVFALLCVICIGVSPHYRHKIMEPKQHPRNFWNHGWKCHIPFRLFSDRQSHKAIPWDLTVWTAEAVVFLGK